MKKSLTPLFCVSFLVLSLVGGRPALAADPATVRPQNATEKVKAKRDWYPFGGIVASMDLQAKTVSLKRKTGARVLRLDAKSLIEIDGRPGYLVNVRVGSYAHGKLHKDAAGNEVITSAKFDKERPANDKRTSNK
jgi:hypothetical protein